ncbi:hypothetical protein LDENG_00222180 [Lucifuga dentata]|nr:hypothetical protein LDENG_00222180 [Lucifuga dentata]
MPKKPYISKTIAAIFVILTASAIAGIITVIIFFKHELSQNTPTPRPIFTTPAEPTGPPPSFRLPGNIVPETYKVYLQPHLYTRIINVENVTSPNQTMVFTGNSTVDFHCVQNTRTIFLHSVDLAIAEKKVLKNRDTDEEIDVTSTMHHNNQSNFLELQLESTLQEGGNYSLFMAFEGEISSGLAGLFVSTYNEGVPGGGDNTER